MLGTGMMERQLDKKTGSGNGASQSSGFEFQTSTTVSGNSEKILSLVICLGLALVVGVVFGQTLGYEFVNYDDAVYVYENAQVSQGLSLRGIEWAFTYGNIGHWHPLTWLSHMLDCQFYGLNPGGHRLTNILLHTATTILLFLVLRRMTGFLWRSAFVAAVFAIHPLRVESVAWVAERKDVLSAFFFMLTLWAYVRYVRRPPSMIRYGVVVLFFALGLLSKNMLVTMPFVLLLLDYWPLNRLPGFTPQVLLRRVAEKIPLFVLTIGSCVATALVPEKLTADRLSFGLRMENAVVSYVTYLWQMLHPSGLACHYPNPVNYLPLWQVAGALGLLLAISGAVWAFRQTHPCFVVGWLWYLGMMIPVIGIVQISNYAHADRYTYLPQIGLYLLLTWAAADLCAGRRYDRWLLGSLASAVIVALILCARTQVSYWKNSTTLWEHTLAVSGDTDVAHNNLGMALLKKGQLDEAMAQFRQALKVNSNYNSAHDNLGVALVKKERLDEAIDQFQRALKINPGDDLAHNDLGMALVQKEQLDAAIAQYQQALKINPDFDMAHFDLGIALAKKGQWDEAIVQYQRALEINPNYDLAHFNLGNAFSQKGKVDEAISQYQQTLKINPDFTLAHLDLGIALAKKGRLNEAIDQYLQALKINPDSDMARINLGNAFFHKGEVDEAITQYQQALKIKPDFDMAHLDLGIALDKNGRLDAAIDQFLQALKINPNYDLAHFNLGNAFLQKGKVDEAISQYQQALKTDPNLEPAHESLGYALLQKGQLDEAIVHYERALEINPGNAGQCNHLAWRLATHPQASVRNGSKATELAQQLYRLSGGEDPTILQTLAAAYAETKRFPEAILTAQQALQLASARNNTALVKDLQKQIEFYQAGEPFRDAGLTNTAAVSRP
jgi:tetratricopeptide (TPR) repeat protein